MLNGKRFAETLSDTQAAEVNEWWRGLAPRDRRDLRRHGGRPPVRVIARFVESCDEKTAEPEAGAGDDFYEYLVNHEIYIDDGPKYHICSAHPEARAAVSSGRISASFRCPRGESRCPMRVLLDQRPEHDVRLSLVRECR